MADGIATTVGNALLASILNGTAFTTYTSPYVQLHVGAPGSAGTANIAGNNVRVASGTWSTPTGGSATNNAAINWTSVSTSETYTHCSLWSASSGGTFLASGPVTASAITAGSNFSIAIGAATVSIPVAS